MRYGKHTPGRVDILAIAAGIVLASFVAPGQSVFASSAERIAEGKVLATERGKGNCLACHMFDDGELPGNMGPPLLAMTLRFPDRQALVEQVCDATIRNPDSRMPPFCRHGILTEQEVQLIVDYLYTL